PRRLVRLSESSREAVMAQVAASRISGYRPLVPAPMRFTADRFSPGRHRESPAKVLAQMFEPAIVQNNFNLVLEPQVVSFLKKLRDAEAEAAPQDTDPLRLRLQRVRGQVDFD